MNAGYYRNWIQQQWANWKEFPPLFKVVGGFLPVVPFENKIPTHTFPYPPEVDVVSYETRRQLLRQGRCNVSVPSRGDWGFLRNKMAVFISVLLFPSPLEVTGVSYECILLCKQLPAEVSVPSRGELCRKLCHWYRTN